MAFWPTRHEEWLANTEVFEVKSLTVLPFGRCARWLNILPEHGRWKACALGGGSGGRWGARGQWVLESSLLNLSKSQFTGTLCFPPSFVLLSPGVLTRGGLFWKTGMWSSRSTQGGSVAVGTLVFPQHRCMLMASHADLSGPLSPAQLCV